jgi:hypothetical protein
MALPCPLTKPPFLTLNPLYVAFSSSLGSAIASLVIPKPFPLPPRNRWKSCSRGCCHKQMGHCEWFWHNKSPFMNNTSNLWVYQYPENQALF